MDVILTGSLYLICKDGSFGLPKALNIKKQKIRDSKLDTI